MLKTTRSDESVAFEKRRLHWQETRQRGIFLFIVTRGILGFGGLCFAIAIISQILTDHGISGLSSHRIAVMTGIWRGAGIFWGVWAWRWLDDQFR